MHRARPHRFLFIVAELPGDIHAKSLPDVYGDSQPHECAIRFVRGLKWLSGLEGVINGGLGRAAAPRCAGRRLFLISGVSSHVAPRLS